MKELEYSDKNTTDDIPKAFPDQCVPAARCQCAGEFVRLLGYTDSIDYLTADLCTFAPVAARLSTEAGECEPQVKKCRSAMDEAMTHARGGQQAHPAVVAKQAARVRSDE